jgi:hypothetical protein
VASAQNPAGGDFHPTDAQVRQMVQTCAEDDPSMLALGNKVSAAVADWKRATAGTGPAAAAKRLDGFFDRVRTEGGLSGRKSIYVLCVEKALRQFVEAWREKPEPVSDNGVSDALQRPDFASEEDIWRSGCRQAERDATSKLQALCGDREFVATGSDCAQLSGSVRTYTAHVDGECRGK